MLDPKRSEQDALGRGAYSAVEGLRLLNFDRTGRGRAVSRQTITRWLRGYDHGDDRDRHSDPLWQPDFANENQQIELSFRDLIELRFVKSFRDLGLSLPAIRECYERAAVAVQDARPFSTQRFRTDGKTIFLDITEDLGDGEMIDLRRRQNVFRTVIEPSLKDLEFDASVVARWYPLGSARKSIIVDPLRAFGRPLARAGVPTSILKSAVQIEGSIARVACLYEVPTGEVRDAFAFENRLAA
jgi:DNA-binding transcriptional MerR regulator